MSVDDDERLIRTVFDRAANGRAMLSADLVHEDAIVIPHSDPPVAFTRDEILAFVELHLHDSPMYEAHAQEIQHVGEGRFVVAGRIRISRGAGFADTPSAWAIEVKDGKLFRVKGTSTAEQACAVLKANDWRPTTAQPVKGSRQKTSQ
jgi:hypothetical protein